MKRFALLLISMILACCSCMFYACGKQDESQPEKQPIQFAPWTQDDFLIGSWVSYAVDEEGSPSMREQTKLLADSGINFLTVASWVPSTGESMARDLSDVTWWKYLDNVMKENNILYNYSASADGANTVGDVPGTVSNTSDAALAYAKSIVPQLNNCVGLMVRDEPNSDEIPFIAEWARKYAQADLGVKPFVNLFPSYVGERYLKGTYEEYVEKWIASVGAQNLAYLSHDYYAFEKTNTRTDIYSDMEVLRKLGLKYDLRTHGFPQSCAWGTMRMPTVNEIRWNVYAYLAYGFKALSYFNYLMWNGEGCYDGIVDGHGKMLHRDIYDGVTDINNDLHYMNDMLMNLDCLHAYHTTAREQGVEILPDDFIVGTQPRFDSNEFIISYMRAKDDTEPHLMIFNKSWRYGTKDEIFTVRADSGINGLEYFNPATQTYEKVKIEDGKFVLSFDAGEGKYLRIKGNVNVK